MPKFILAVSLLVLFTSVQSYSQCCSDSKLANASVGSKLGDVVGMASGEYLFDPGLLKTCGFQIKKSISDQGCYNEQGDKVNGGVCSNLEEVYTKITNVESCKPTQSPQGDLCQQYEALEEEFGQKAVQTKNSCDLENDNQLLAAGGKVAKGASAIANQIGINSSCAAMNSASAAASSALFAFHSRCDTAIKSCDEVYKKLDSILSSQQPGGDFDTNCRKISSARPSIDQTYKDGCGDFQKKNLAQANQEAQNLARNVQQSQQCAQQTNGTGLPGLGKPGDPSGNCSDPAFAATSEFCKCLTNPNGPGCSGGSHNGGGVSFGSTGGSGSTFGSGGSGGGLDLGSMGPGGNGDPVNQKPGGGGPDDDLSKMGGHGGAGVGGGGAGGSMASGGSGGAGAGGAAGGVDEKGGILAGFRNAVGGMFGFGNKTSGSADSASNGYRAQKGGPDLRQFLPGGQFDPKRGLAGGLGGANNDIWKQINVRYQEKHSTLLP